MTDEERERDALRRLGGLPVSESALFDRINRALTKEGKKLRRVRGRFQRNWYGTFVVVSTAERLIQTEAILKRRVNLEKLGRKLGVLKPHEGFRRGHGR
jgi:phosphohistidine phosphatase SixA